LLGFQSVASVHVRVFSEFVLDHRRRTKMGYSRRTKIMGRNNPCFNIR
jgi:hypothetical protein